MIFANPGVRMQAEQDSWHTEPRDLPAIMLAFHQLEGTLGTVFSTTPGGVGSTDRNTHPYYDNVPFSYTRFLESLRQCWRVLDILNPERAKLPRKNRYKFLDVGCGLGVKMFLAQQQDWDVHGLEINPAYAEIAAHVNGYPYCEKRVKTVNAIDYTNYGDYDCIYFYVPCRNRDREVALEQQVYKYARPRSLIYSAFIYDMERPKDIHCLKWGHGLLFKGTDEEFDDLCKSVQESKQGTTT